MPSKVIREHRPLLSDLVPKLKDVFLDLATHPYPEVANPPGVERRASVAVIIRIRPDYAHWPSDGRYSQRNNAKKSPAVAFDGNKFPSKDRIETFFEQDWVKYGDPEVLFIKRASRVGDRWTGHVALPGGRRDLEDADDEAAAVRESMEEVGIDLSYPNAIAVGNLPQRVVTTSWGKIPLMVLCPYVFLVVQHDVPLLRLQPTEVAAIHWVSIRALLSPTHRTFESQDVSNRLAKQGTGIKRWVLRAMLGRMLFAAVHLVPTESQYCSSIPGFIPNDAENSRTDARGWIGRICDFRNANSTTSHSQERLLLWGLTLGVIADFLELLPPHTALELWTYPTFTPWDIRIMLWVMSYSFRRQKQQELSLYGSAPLSSLEEPVTNTGQAARSEADEETPNQVLSLPLGKIEEMGSGLHYRIRDRQLTRNSAIGTLLEGYYDLVRKALMTTLILRMSFSTLFTVYIWLRYRQRLASRSKY